MQLATGIVTVLMVAALGQGATLEIRPLSLPPEFSTLGVASMHSDRRQMIVIAVEENGSCVVAILSETLSILKLRAIPGAVRNACNFVGFDSAGNIVLTGFSSSSEFLFTDDLGPLPEAGSQFLLKLSRASLETLFSVRVRIPGPYAVAMAPDDTIWMGGFTRDGLITTPDAVQRVYPGSAIDIQDNRDSSGFLSRFSADGRKLLYSTYLGGLREGVATISIAPNGDVYAAGIRVWKFSGSGQLIWSTWLSPSSAFGSAIGPQGDLYIAGTTGGPEFYTTPSAFQPVALAGQTPLFVGSLPGYPRAALDGFVARFSSDGDLVYSTLMGGISYDILHQVLVDADGSAWVRGYSDRALFPTRGAIAMRLASGSVLAKLAPDGSKVAFSTYLEEGAILLVAHPEGGLWMRTYTPAERFGLRRVTELPDSLPRIDAVIRTAQPASSLLAGTNATISGEGFSVVTGATVGDVPARIVSQSECLLEIEIPADLPGLTPQAIFTGDVRLFRGSEILQQIRVQVFAPFLP